MHNLLPQTVQLQQSTENNGEGGVQALQVKGIGSNNKRGLDGMGKEGGQLSMKKCKTEEDSVKVKERKERAVDRLRKMITKESCLMMERAIYAEEELQ